MAYNNRYNDNRNNNYNNNNNNRYDNRNNNGYKRYNNYNNQNRFNEFEQENRYNEKRYDNKLKDEFAVDLLPIAKQDIKIRDLRGIIYTIPGDFSADFVSYLTKIVDKVKDFEKQRNNPDVFPEMVKELKQVTLQLINLDVDGKSYTIDDVNRGFNNVDALWAIFNMAITKTQESLDNSNLVKK